MPCPLAGRAGLRLPASRALPVRALPVRTWPAIRQGRPGPGRAVHRLLLAYPPYGSRLAPAASGAAAPASSAVHHRQRIARRNGRSGQAHRRGIPAQCAQDESSARWRRHRRRGRPGGRPSPAPARKRRAYRPPCGARGASRSGESPGPDMRKPRPGRLLCPAREAHRRDAPAPGPHRKRQCPPAASLS